MGWILTLLLLASKFFKDVFGIEALGKKIYKGAPLIWKWFMQSSIFRKDVNDRLDLIMMKMGKIEEQVHTNGGGSMKDSLVRIENDITEMKGQVKENASKNDARDMCSERWLFRLGKDGSCTFINDAFLKYFGYPESSVLGWEFENIVHDDDVLEMRNKWNMAIERKSKFYDEQRIMDIDGKVHDCVVKGYPICRDKELVEFYGTIDLIEPKNENNG